MHKILFLFLLAVSLTTTASTEISKPKLSDFKYNDYSQFGEDGIIEKIFEIIGTTSKLAVEFGAADGYFCSNTAKLWTNDLLWRAVLIETDPKLFIDLKNNTKPYSCIPLHLKVGVGPKDSIEAILDELHIVSPIDLLSIDIDNDDYYIFQSLKKIRPRVIICEYNPTFPADLDIYPALGAYMGCSVSALKRVAAEKRYSLVAITDTNCIFVRNEDFPKFAAFDTTLEGMRINRYLSYIVTDFSGKYFHVAGENFGSPFGLHGPSSQTIEGDITVLPPL